MATFVYPVVFCLPSNFHPATAAPVEKLGVSVLEQPAQWERFIEAGLLRLRLPPQM
jgi:hypothetical protein